MDDTLRRTLPFARQDVVTFDVGGKWFKLSAKTVSRYPDSLLAKLIAQFRDLAQKGIEVFVDRNPSTFPWIQEIYRDADYKNCVPEMSMEALEKELEFYQLPSLEELGIGSVSHLSPKKPVKRVPFMKTTKTGFIPKETTAQNLVQQILDEIDACGVKDMYPWDVLFYQKIVDGALVSGRKVFICVPNGIDRLNYVTENGHNDFFTALKALYSDCHRSLHDDRLIMIPRGTDVKFVVTLATDEFIGLLKSQTDKLGLHLSKASVNFVCNTGHNQTFNALRVTYNAD